MMRGEVVEDQERRDLPAATFFATLYCTPDVLMHCTAGTGTTSPTSRLVSRRISARRVAAVTLISTGSCVMLSRTT